MPPQGNGTSHSRHVDASLSSRWRLAWGARCTAVFAGVIVQLPELALDSNASSPKWKVEKIRQWSEIAFINALKVC